MFWKVFYAILFVSHCVFCNEIEQNEEEHEIEVPYEFVSVEQYDENKAQITNTSEENHGNIIDSIIDQPNEVVSEENKHDEEETNREEKEDNEKQSLSFSGPVKAKGSVAVGASFGYDAPGLFNYPTFPSFFPLFPQYHFHPLPFLYPIFIPIPYTPIVATVLPGNTQNKNDDDNDKPQNTFNDNGKGKSTKKVVCVAPTNKVEESDLDLTKSHEEQDDNFSDLHENEANDDEYKGNDTAGEGVVFSGLLPAKGGVRIAARF